MRRANALSAAALKYGGQHIEAGMTTWELDKLIYDFIVKHGGTPNFKGLYGFPGTACISLNDTIIHGIPSHDIVIRPGDIVSIDTGAKVDGFNGDNACTYAVGKIDLEAQRLLDVTKAALYKGIEQAKAGNRIGDIGYAVQSYCEDAGSRLSYPSFFTNERKVFLSGEGFFDVAKNETSPFIVSTQTIDVKAIGTRFNVFSYPDGDYTGVFLQEGKVKAYFPSEEAKGIVLLPEQYLVQKDGRLELSVMDSDELLWREGIYTFKKQKLGNIIKKLELYYDVEIVVSDPEILRYEYVGKFRQRDGVMEILRVIQRIHGFKIRRHEEENRIVLSK